MRSRVDILYVPLLASLFLLAGRPAQAVEPPGLENVAWMVGSWSGESESVEMEEMWTAPKGGLMLGLHRDVRPDGKAFFEYLRIEEGAEGLTYYASPRGNQATAFALVEISARYAVFENPDNDFPQRILYRLEDDGSLTARIEGENRGEPKALEWNWRPADTQADAPPATEDSPDSAGSQPGAEGSP